MAMQVVTGPPWAGRSAEVLAVRREGEVLLDAARIADAVRSAPDSPVVREALRRGLTAAVGEDRDGWVVVSARGAELQGWLKAAGQDKALLLVPPDGVAIPDIWRDYEDDQDLAALTTPWTEERTMDELEIRYRQACDATAHTECGERVQRRVLLEVCELRAGDGEDQRMVSGIAVRYDDTARIWDMRERIKPGALQLPEGPANLTLQHDRALPLGLIEWQDDKDALRLSAKLPDGMRQDQALADINSGLLRGLSLEFVPVKDRRIPADDNEKADVWEIEEARVIRCSVVDDGAYPKSKVAQRAGCGCGQRQTVDVPMLAEKVDKLAERMLKFQEPFLEEAIKRALEADRAGRVHPAAFGL